ncbi:HlyD family type I secretion periplasmic adaptor subunit [Azohydromonas aeria]|uniref:HlyD family type I secretion periplasmic adaptor subunit n=1 Tax=Azohydromonas aeria TaxID=2590212 RepID=UPI0012FAB9EC|nr:HlyD family type I secretion periplasmic adaptor subunit [Azohydromonas aeria]
MNDDFTNATAPAARRRGSLLGSALIWLVTLTLGALVAWSAVSEVDEVVRAQATVIASRRVQVIQSVDGGVLAQLGVAEGDRVRKGQVLARFDETRSKSELDATSAKRASLLASMARLRAELAGAASVSYPAEVRGFPELMRDQDLLFAGRRANLQTDLATLTGIVRTAREELAITEKLLADGDSNRMELLRATRMVSEAQAKVDSRRNQYVQDASAELAKARDELQQIQEQATQRRRQLDNVVVASPMDGIVKNVRFTTLGAVLKPGDELLSIVPVDDRMIVEAKVAPRDIAQVRPGLESMIKFDAYDYTVYGAVHGQVAYVGADSMREEGQRPDTPGSTYYRVHVATPSPAATHTGRSLDVIPGMTATIDIRTGRRTVLEFLLKPVVKTFSEAFGER